MRWLGLLILLIGLVLSGGAFAMPNADAEAAYARGDYATAFKIWLPLAEQGSAQAQRNVARMYERGEWVAPDRQAAMEWYRRADEQGGRDVATPNYPATGWRTDAVTLPAAVSTRQVPSATPSTRPDRKLVSPMKPATKRVAGRS